jgi:hypothetical protein
VTIIGNAQPVSTRVNGSEGGQRTYTSTWRVLTDSRENGATVAWHAPGLPKWGEIYLWGTGTGLYNSDSWDTGAWVQTAPSAALQSENDSLKVWLVTITHSSRAGLVETAYDNPVDAPWEVERDADEWTEEAVKTVDGKPIWNSALRAIGGKETEIYKTRTRWTLVKNFWAVPALWFNLLERSMNSSSIQIVGIIYPPLTLYMRKIQVRVLYYANEGRYFRVTFNIDHNPNTHNLKLVDKGRHYFKAGGNVWDPKSYVEITDSETLNPQPDGSYYLNGNGQVLPQGSAPVMLNQPNGFQVYYTYEWNAIGFPS